MLHTGFASTENKNMNCFKFSWVFVSSSTSCPLWGPDITHLKQTGSLHFKQFASHLCPGWWWHSGHSSWFFCPRTVRCHVTRTRSLLCVSLHMYRINWPDNCYRTVVSVCCRGHRLWHPEPSRLKWPYYPFFLHSLICKREKWNLCFIDYVTIYLTYITSLNITLMQIFCL